MNNAENWVQLPGFRRYMISDRGRLRSREHGLLVQEYPYPDGSRGVKLLDNEGKSILKKVHRLVADTFLYDPDGYSRVDWVNGNRTDNSVGNLYRVKEVDPTVKKTLGVSAYLGLVEDDEDRLDREARERKIADRAAKVKAGDRRRGPKDPRDRSHLNTFGGRPAQKLRVVETGEIFASQSACAKAMGLNQAAISAVLRGRSSQHGGYHFEYYTEES